MESTTPLNSDLIEDGESRENLVTDDRTIYDELIAPLESRMIRSIWRIVRNVDLAEDCLQEALVVIWKKRFLVRRHPNPPALILKICLDTAYGSLRRLDRIRHQTDLSQMDNIPASPGQNPVRKLEEKEIEEQVQRAIHRLPRKRALAVMMRLIQEESFEAIAKALSCSEATARIHISKGCAQLRRWLAPILEGSRQEAGDE